VGLASMTIVLSSTYQKPSIAKPAEHIVVSLMTLVVQQLKKEQLYCHISLYRKKKEHISHPKSQFL